MYYCRLQNVLEFKTKKTDGKNLWVQVPCHTFSRFRPTANQLACQTSCNISSNPLRAKNLLDFAGVSKFKWTYRHHSTSDLLVHHGPY
jgi:hypothetical protein